jgi:hypothetical protein
MIEDTKMLAEKQRPWSTSRILRSLPPNHCLNESSHSLCHITIVYGAGTIFKEQNQSVRRQKQLAPLCSKCPSRNIYNKKPSVVESEPEGWNLSCFSPPFCIFTGIMLMAWGGSEGNFVFGKNRTVFGAHPCPIKSRLSISAGRLDWSSGI